MSDDRMIVVDGVSYPPASDETKSLVRWLREDLGMTRSKVGCGEGACGACTVWLDGLPVPGCLVSVGRAGGRSVLTVAGVLETDAGARVAEALVAASALQCGFCTPGLIVTAAYLVSVRAHLTPEQLAVELSGHLCRCTGYQQLLTAVQDALSEPEPLRANGSVA